MSFILHDFVAPEYRLTVQASTVTPCLQELLSLLSVVNVTCWYLHMYIGEADFFGVKILNFRIFWVFRKTSYFLG